jgi:hypothetical protein
LQRIRLWFAVQADRTGGRGFSMNDLLIGLAICFLAAWCIFALGRWKRKTGERQGFPETRKHNRV